ncbi:hypothetical protein [Kordiimonas sp.]|uniref:hypothetical protein n=1 Tax=Kordiimonas sp. TaxID=1970157 RepID=UPI003A945DE9
MNCDQVKHAIDLASVEGSELPLEARAHIEGCEGCHAAMNASLLLSEHLRTLPLSDAPQGMDARIAARIAALPALKQAPKKRQGTAGFLPWGTAILGVFGFLAFSLRHAAGEAVQKASAAPAGSLESSPILGDAWQAFLAPQTLISGLSADFMMLGLFALCSLAAMSQMVRR